MLELGSALASSIGTQSDRAELGVSTGMNAKQSSVAAPCARRSVRCSRPVLAGAVLGMLGEGIRFAALVPAPLPVGSLLAYSVARPLRWPPGRPSTTAVNPTRGVQERFTMPGTTVGRSSASAPTGRKPAA